MPKKRKISTLGANIKHFRTERKISQRALAEKADIEGGKVAICKLETGMYGGVDDPTKLVRIAKALHVSVETLVSPRKEAPKMSKKLEDLLS